MCSFLLLGKARHESLPFFVLIAFLQQLALFCCVIFLKLQIINIDQNLYNTNLLIAHLANFSGLAILTMINVSLHPLTNIKETESVSFDCNKIGLRCMQTYLFTFLLYLIWKFADVSEKQDMRDPILREAVPAPVYL